jgi:hypothetical protein
MNFENLLDFFSTILYKNIMNNTSLYRDFSFEEWTSLLFEAKRVVWNKYWNPFEPDIGEATRSAILTQFRKRYSKLFLLALDVGFGYFGHYVACLYAIVPDSKVLVPRKFADIIVNKGVVKKIIDETTVIVDWRDVGGSNCEFKIKGIKTFQKGAAPDREQQQ